MRPEKVDRMTAGSIFSDHFKCSDCPQRGSRFGTRIRNQVAKTTGNTASKVNNNLFIWLLRIWWCRLWPKNGWGDPPGGPQCWKNISFGYKWLQKLIIICWYSYRRCGEVVCDPKMGGGTPRGVLNVKKTPLSVINGCKS